MRIKDTFECKAFITPPYFRTAVMKQHQTKTLEASDLLSRSSRPSLRMFAGRPLYSKEVSYLSMSNSARLGRKEPVGLDMRFRCVDL